MLRDRQAHFDRVRVMLYQPRQVFREVMRSLFQSSGFRKLAYADSVDSLQRHLAEPFFHLMVVHEEGSEDLGFDVLDLVGRL